MITFATAPEPEAPPVAAPPAFETLVIDTSDEVGTLTLSRPEHGNAMSPVMLAELPVATAWLADEARLRALVVTGAGDEFSLGGDLEEMRRLAATVDIAADSRRRIDQLHQAVLNLRRVEYPVVAAVNGAAAGSGFALALACDERVASERASFSAAYGRVGLTPDGGMTYFLPRFVGEARAVRLLLEDAPLSAERALADGLVGEVVPPEKLLAAARRRAVRLTRRAPGYVAAVKRLVGGSFHSTLAEHLQLERHAFADASGTHDFARGLEARFAGRRPEFNGD